MNYLKKLINFKLKSDNIFKPFPLEEFYYTLALQKIYNISKITISQFADGYTVAIVINHLQIKFVLFQKN